MEALLVGEADTGGDPTFVIATDGEYLAWAVPSRGQESSCVDVVYLPQLSARALRLSASLQHKEVTALAVGQGYVGSSDPSSVNPTQPEALLVAASPEAVVLWRLAQAYEAVASRQPLPEPLLVLERPGQVDAACLSSPGGANLLALCAGLQVHVFELAGLTHSFLLEGHGAPVRAATFCEPHRPLWLLTAGEDRSFKLWDLQQGSLVYQSPILTAYALTSLAVDPTFLRVAVGAADGVVRVFDLATLPACRCVQITDVPKHLRRISGQAALKAAARATAPPAQPRRSPSSALLPPTSTTGPRVLTAPPTAGPTLPPRLNQALPPPPLQQQVAALCEAAGQRAAEEGEGEGEGAVACGAAVLRLHYAPLRSRGGGEGGGEGAGEGSDLLGESPKLLVGTMSALAVIDSHTGEVVQAHFLRGGLPQLSLLLPGPSQGPAAPPGPPRAAELLSDVSVAGAYALGLPRHQRFMYCCMAAAYSSDITILSLRPMTPTTAAAAAAAGGAGLGSGGGGGAAGVRAKARGGVGGLGPQYRPGPADGVLSAVPLPSPAAAAAAAAASGQGPGLLRGAAQRLPQQKGNSEGGERWEEEEQQQQQEEEEEGEGEGQGEGEGGLQAAPLSVFQAQPLPDHSPLRLPLQSGAAPGHTPNPPHLRQPSPSRLAPAPASLLPATAAPERTRWAAPTAPTPAAGGPPRAPLKRSSSSGSGGHPPDPRPSPASPGKAGRGGGRGRGQAGANQPVTFHRKVKSSGYGFVHPAARLGRPPPAPVSVRTRPCAASTVAKHLLQARQYPVSSGPPAHPQPQHCLPGQPPLHQGALLRLRFSGDASRLLTCSADRTARVIKLPLAKHQGEGTDLLGHNGSVVGIDWSHDGVMVLTASADRSARLWNAGCAQPLLELSHLQQQQPRLALGGPAAGSGPGAGAGGAGAAAPTLSTGLAAGAASAAVAKANPPFLHEVRAARFYYLDEFILLAAGNKLNLYRYKLGEGDPNDDIARLRNTNKYRLAASYASNMQAINDFASVNSFLSPLALLAGTNRSVEVLDCTVMQCVAVVDDAHARPVHTIAQSASASLYTSHPKEALELFLTAACDGLIKLWDVRSCRCVRSFSAHKNTQITTGVAFSPCLRFIASGSEDQAAYLYDVRQGQMLHRMRTSDVVTDVAFNPLHPQLAAGCLDGRVHFFSVA